MAAGSSDQDYPKLSFVGQQTEWNANLQRQQMSRRLVGLFIPAGLAGASFSFLGSPDGVSWYRMQQIHGGGDYTVPATPDTYVPLDPRVVAGAAYLRLESDADETGKEIHVSMRAID